MLIRTQTFNGFHVVTNLYKKKKKTSHCGHDALSLGIKLIQWRPELRHGNAKVAWFNDRNDCVIRSAHSKLSFLHFTDIIIHFSCYNYIVVSVILCSILYLYILFFKRNYVFAF